MTRKKKRCRPGRPLAATILLTLAFGILPFVVGADVKKENKETAFLEYSYDGGGFDEHAFATAAQMLEVAPFGSSTPQMFDFIGKIYVEGVAKTFNGKVTDILNIDGETAWRNLLQANPYRRQPEVQEMIEYWANVAAGTIFKKEGSAPVEMLEAANALYKRGQLDEASAKYRGILDKYPADRKARNNLALSQMHLGNDLLAQLHWETLVSADPEYVPARVNLTVLYTRLGFIDESRNLSRTLAETHRGVPMVAFNEAWFLTGEKKLDQASALMKHVTLPSIPSRYKNFGLLIRKMKILSQTKPDPKTKFAAPSHSVAQERSFWKEGLAGRMGGRSSLLSRIVSLLVFTVLAFLAMAISAGLGSGLRPQEASGAGCVTFLFVGSFLYILSWGIPSGWGWGLMVGFVFLCGILSAGIADNA